MLNIINQLKPFFEDNYKRIHVREYAKLIEVAPPTSSKYLESLKENNLLKKETDKQYHYYFANKNSKTFIDLQRIYYRIKLSKLIDYIKYETINPIIILFGSLAKAEVSKKSDIDLAVFTVSKKEMDFDNFESELNRDIQVFAFKSINEVNSDLKNSILNGYKLEGNW